MKNSEGCFAAIVSLLIGLPLGGALYAWAAELNWNWFATTLGAPRIGFWQAYGVGLVVSCFVPSATPSKSDDDLGEAVAKMFAVIFARFGALAGMGWLIHVIMTP